MNVLYIADPGSIHDVRWINAFAEKENSNCYIVVRRIHQNNTHNNGFHPHVRILGMLDDPSTIRPFRNRRQLFRMRSIIRDHKIDLFHVLYAEPNALWLNGRNYLGVPSIITTRGSDVLRTIPAFFEGRSWLKKLIACQYRTAFAKADAVTCTSFEQMARVKSFATAKRLSVVRTGVDFSTIGLAGLDRARTLGIMRPYVLMPRKMEPVYNHEFTLEAISLLSPQIKDNFAFVFLDSDTRHDSYLAFIRGKAQSTAADVRFLPLQKPLELIALYRQSALVVMNPYSDGSPVTAMEAAACKIPVILPPLSYDNDLFAAQFSFSEWSPTALRDTMERVLSMPQDELATVVDVNYERILSAGNAATEMRKIHDLYQELIDENQ